MCNSHAIMGHIYPCFWLEGASKVDFIPITSGNFPTLWIQKVTIITSVEWCQINPIYKAVFLIIA